MSSAELWVREWFETYEDPELNIATMLCDRHDPDAVAFTVVNPTDMSVQDLTYGELRSTSERLASALQARGVTVGALVPVLMGKRAELIIVLLALWRLGAVHVPLFTAFAKGAIPVVKVTR